MVTGDDPLPDCCLMIRRHTQGRQVKEVIHLETVDIQNDNLAEFCGQRESGRWLARCELRRQTDWGLNSGSVIYIQVNLDKSYNF